MGTRVARRGRLRIGTSGYQYRHWLGTFYPHGLARPDWFAHYAGAFDTVEINNTFYRLPDAPVFEDWRRRAPAGFRYAVKLSRYVTHVKRLRAPAAPLRRFLRRAAHLGNRLGPVLVQLPPHWGARPDRLEGFLRAAPRWIRWAVEVRDRSWLCEETYALLERYGAALCWHDALPRHPRRRTTGWLYVRFHGRDYGGRYPSRTLTAWARRIRAQLDAGHDVWVFFNNDRDGHAPRDAARLRRAIARVTP